jgi:hypothetical protein
MTRNFLTGGRNLDRIKLVECKSYLKKNGLSQVGDMTTCVERIMLHWRLVIGYFIVMNYSLN